MKVNDVEITEAQIQAMLAAMNERFRAADIIAAAEAAGVKKGTISNRAADRIIQKQRKARAIRLLDSGPYWTNQIDT